MEIASKLLEENTEDVDAKGRLIHPLDAQFRSLGLESMDPINPKSSEFAGLQRYTSETHGATHSHYKVQVQHAFRVERCVF